VTIEDAILVNLNDNVTLSNLQVHSYSTYLINHTAVGPIPIRAAMRPWTSLWGVPHSASRPRISKSPSRFKGRR
jgi:hypothetical protein